MAYHLKRVNAHAERRELSTSVLGDFIKFPNYQKQESKVDVLSYVLMSALCYHTSNHYKFNILGSTYEKANANSYPICLRNRLYWWNPRAKVINLFVNRV